MTFFVDKWFRCQGFSMGPGLLHPPHTPSSPPFFLQYFSFAGIQSKCTEPGKNSRHHQQRCTHSAPLYKCLVSSLIPPVNNFVDLKKKNTSKKTTNLCSSKTFTQCPFRMIAPPTGLGQLKFTHKYTWKYLKHHKGYYKMDF